MRKRKKSKKEWKRKGFNAANGITNIEEKHRINKLRENNRERRKISVARCKVKY